MVALEVLSTIIASR